MSLYDLLQTVILLWTMVEPKHDGQPDSQGSAPAYEYHGIGRFWVVAVLGVKDWGGDGKESVKADCNQVEY